jgi:hypothetical protein
VISLSKLKSCRLRTFVYAHEQPAHLVFSQNVSRKVSHSIPTLSRAYPALSRLRFARLFSALPPNDIGAPFARTLLEWAMRHCSIRPRINCLDAAYCGPRLIALIHAIERQVDLTYAASIIVGLTAQHAGRPELIRSRHSRPHPLLRDSRWVGNALKKR